MHNHLTGALAYPLHTDVLESQAVQATYSRYGTYLCAQASPDGAPTHCAYPSGHSVGAGATITMLKAIFDEHFVIPNPVEPSADGLALQPYVGPLLTVGGKLNKLAFNIGMARVIAGIHWRSDVIEGNRLGQEVAISILQDMQRAVQWFCAHEVRRDTIPALTCPESLTERPGQPGRLSLARQCTTSSGRRGFPA